MFKCWVLNCNHFKPNYVSNNKQTKYTKGMSNNNLWLLLINLQSSRHLRNPKTLQNQILGKVNFWHFSEEFHLNITTNLLCFHLPPFFLLPAGLGRQYSCHPTLRCLTKKINKNSWELNLKNWNQNVEGKNLTHTQKYTQILSLMTCNHIIAV